MHSHACLFPSEFGCVVGVQSSLTVCVPSTLSCSATAYLAPQTQQVCTSFADVHLLLCVCTLFLLRVKGVRALVSLDAAWVLIHFKMQASSSNHLRVVQPLSFTYLLACFATCGSDVD